MPRKKKSSDEPGIGVTGVRRRSAEGQKRTLGAAAAAEASGLFPQGGLAFAKWLASRKGVDASERRTQEEWDVLLEEFAARPIHGHRRGPQGGTHRINKQHRR